MRITKIVTIIFIILTSLQIYGQQEPKYYFILEHIESWSVIGDYSKSSSKEFKYPMGLRMATIDKDGNYSFISLSKDLYGNFTVQELLVNPEKNIVGSGELITDGYKRTAADGNPMHIMTYKIDVTSENVVITKTVDLVDVSIDAINSKKSFSIVGFISIETYKRYGQ
jgi:hypothetical protein